jgi:dienelactone hydrolase
MSTRQISSFNLAQIRSIRGIIASAVLALTLAIGAGASAQAPAADPIVTKTRQVGFWTVYGASQAFCAAERPVPDGNGSGLELLFMLFRVGSGYQIALEAAEWSLTPGSTFPIELTVGPEFNSKAMVRAANPKLVSIELDAYRELIDALGTAPTLEIKAAQATFNLPMDGFGDALKGVDLCFDGAKPPADPTAEPEEATAAPTESHDELIEERTFLTVAGSKRPYRLEALVVRPAKTDGRLPVALITHGKNLLASENQAFRADLMLPQARDLAARGWLAVAVIRRGYGLSDGIPGVSRGAAYMSCQNSDLVRGFDIEADDLVGALEALAARQDADLSRVIAVGQSLGGGTVLAFAARKPAGLRAVVNISGGVWRSAGNGVCDHADLVGAMASFGSRTSVPSLWLYAENDSLFPPVLVTRMRDAYAQAGGQAELRMFPPVLGDGHALFSNEKARKKWLQSFDAFMQTQKAQRPMMTGAITTGTTTR